MLGCGWAGLDARKGASRASLLMSRASRAEDSDDCAECRAVRVIRDACELEGAPPRGLWPFFFFASRNRASELISVSSLCDISLVERSSASGFTHAHVESVSRKQIGVGGQSSVCSESPVDFRTHRSI